MSLSDPPHENAPLPATMLGMMTKKSRIFSEDDLSTFEGWLEAVQGIDPTKAAPDDLARWRALFDDRKPGPQVVMNLGPVSKGEHRHAVAVREASQLWLTLWVRRSRSGIFVMVPRADRKWDPHTSYHAKGAFHSKSFGHKHTSQQRQSLTGAFHGTEHLGAYAGHGPKTVGAVYNPAAFSGVVELRPGILGPFDGQVLVDLVEPGCNPIWWPGRMRRQVIFKEALPWVVIRVFSKSLPHTAS